MRNIAGFYWTVQFNDKTVIEQFDKDDNEVMYADVVKKGEENITEFKILDINGETVSNVNLQESAIYNGNIKTKVKGKNPQLVYRRRVVRGVLGPDGNIMTMPSVIKHHIGIKTDKETKIAEVYLEKDTNVKKSKLFSE